MFEHIVELAAFPLVIGESHAGMVADLAQFSEGLQDQDAVLRVVGVEMLEEVVAGGRFFAFVEFFLFGIHFGIKNLGTERGEVLSYFFFGPAQKVGGHQLAESNFLFLVASLFDRGDEFFLKKGVAPEQVWVDELHLRPEVGEGVFDRGAAQGYLVPAFQLVDGAEYFAFAVFDLLAFVQYDVFVFQFAEQFDVAQGGLVGGEEDIEAAQEAHVGISLVAHVEIDAEAGGEFADFRFPIEYQGGGEDDQSVEGL